MSLLDQRIALDNLNEHALQLELKVVAFTHSCPIFLVCDIVIYPYSDSR